jgi:hypothetical protein
MKYIYTRPLETPVAFGAFIPEDVRHFYLWEDLPTWITRTVLRLFPYKTKESAEQYAGWLYYGLRRPYPDYTPVVDNEHEELACWFLTELVADPHTPLAVAVIAQELINYRQYAVQLSFKD